MTDNTELNYGCLIRVSDINRVRAFYRDILELGDPLIDSNFWLEFNLPGNGILAIEQSSGVTPGENRQDVSCLIGVDELDKRLKELEGHAVTAIRPSREVPGRQTATICDPEGNLITLYRRVPTDA